MKKLLIASAVAAACITPLTALADAPTVYGNFRWSVASIEDGNADATVQAVNNASRLGFKGKVGDDGGLTGFYHLQMGAENDAGGPALSTRFYHAGVTGDFGTVLLGRTSTPYKMAAVSGGFDPFYDTIAGRNNGGSSFGLSNLTNGWIDNVIAYVGKTGNISYNAVGVIDDTAADDHGINVGVKYGADMFSVGVQYLMAEALNVDSAIRLHGTFKTGALNLSASVESIEYMAGGVTQADAGTYMFLAAQYKLDGGHSVEAQFGSNDDNVATGARETEGTGFSIGYSHKLAKKTTMRLIYSDVSAEVDADSRSAIGVMMVQSF